ncbi:MAG: RNA 2'-phosphotransferase [Oscillospiraceae bacterium]|nr:RNA 2'-phosphotransferase [Oscillospiraceae bacterium]
MKDLKKTSVFLALILRHKPEAIGISLDQNGWAGVEDIINGINRADGYSMDMETLEEIVRTDNKQRYSFNEDKTKIRANQGHSVNVDVELKECEPPEQLFHGTGEKFAPAIRKEGLKPKSRLYVHLSKDKETAENVGARHGQPHIFFVHSGKMYRQGYKFYLSENGVWLTKRVPPEFLGER